MNAKEIFSAAIRVIGLLSAARGLSYLFYVVLFQTGNADVSVTAKFPSTELGIGLFFVLIGLYLLRGAPLIMDYAFPQKQSYERLAAEEDSADEEDPD